MLAGNDAPSWSLAIAERHQDHSLVSVKAVPQCLQGVRRISQGQVHGRRREMLRILASVEQLIQVMSEQNRSLWVSAREGEKLVDGTVDFQTIRP